MRVPSIQTSMESPFSWGPVQCSALRACALPMPPDPVGQHARSRAGPPLKFSGAVRRSRADALALGFAAGAGVEAEAVGELAAGFQDDRGDFLLDPLGGEAERGRGDGDRADDVARVVANGRGDGADLLNVLAEIDRVAVGGDRAQLLEKRLAVDDG